VTNRGSRKTEPTTGRPALHVGVVTRPHGLRGEVRVHLDWDGSRSLLDSAAVTLERDGRRDQFQVASARVAAKVLLLKLEGIDDRDQAEALRGAQVFLERTDLEPLDDGEYYLADLVGARVVAPDGPVGVVESIEIHPTVDALVIRTESDERLQQPLLDAFIEDVDVEAGVVTLTSREGLI